MYTTNKEWHKAKDFLQKEEWKEALSLLRVLRKEFSSEAEIEHEWIKTKFLLGEGSSELLRSSVAKFPLYLPLQRDMSALLLHEQKYEEALEKTRENFQVFGESSELWTDYGVIFRHINKPFQAKSAYQRAISLNPDSEFSWFNWANMHFEAGEYSQAEQLYLRVVRMNEKNIEAWVQLIISVFFTQEFVSAFHYVCEAKRRGGRLPIFLYWESRIQQQRKNIEEAKHAIHLALQNGNRKIYWEQLISLLILEGKDISEAEEFLKRAQ